MSKTRILNNGVLVESTLTLNPEIFGTLEQAFLLVQERLRVFASDTGFSQNVALAFGEDIATEPLQTAWLAGDVSNFPQIDILSGTEINGAKGAYAGATNRIYLSGEFLSLNETNPEAIASILLEEYGHRVDAVLNSNDTPGDEGAIFSALVQGQVLSQEQLQQLKAENDTATVTIDGQLVEIEQATVSDSGGFEGSQQTVKLESKGGGVAKFSYQHFTIPDQFIIRYEGKELLNTGFVGGGRSGEVQIPKGNSDVLEILIATNDQGTAWNYTVTTDSCPDPDPFVLELVGGEFEDTDGDGDCDGQGTIYIGRKDGIARMLKIDGRVEYTDKKISVDGTIFSVIGAGSVTTNPLFNGKFDIDIGSGKTTSFQETGKLPNEYTLGGLDIDFSGLTINRNGLALGAKFKLLEEIGFPELFFSGSDALLISQNNVTFGSSVKFSLPKFENFNLFKFLPIKEFSNFAIEYIAPEDKIKIQGKLVIDDFTKTEKLGIITADLSGDNFIEIQGGKADIKGSLAVKTNLKLTGGWALKELKLDIDTKKKDVGGSTKIEFPFKAKIPPGSSSEAGVGLGFKLPIPPLDLNKVSINVDKLNIPIPEFPLVFFQRFAGSVENLAKSDPDPIEFAGGVGATLGPQFNLNLSIPPLGVDIKKNNLSLIRLDLDGKINSEQLTGTSKIVLLDDIIAKGDGTSTLNWNKKFFETKGNFSLLDGLIKTNSGFKVNSSFNINMFGKASVGIPNFIPLFGGAQIAGGNFLLDFSNDGVLANDFAAGWGTLSIQKLGFEINTVLGFKVYFDGSVEPIGSKSIPPIGNFARFERIDAENIPPVGSFAIAPDTEWIFLGADWENPVNGDVPIQVELPDGNIINEADFAANNIAVVEELSDSTTKVVVVFNPKPGIWDINVVDKTGLGTVKYTANTDSFLPSIKITAPTTDISGGLVTINYNAFDPDSNAEIKLFYDDDNQGFDGIQIVDGLVENDGIGSFLWNTEGVPTGDYFIYGMVMDENNPPAFSYSSGRVTITEKADLSVTKTANLSSVVAGNNLTYTVTVTNNGLADAKDVTLVETLPEGATFISATATPSQQTGNTLTFDLGNLAKDASQTFAFTITAPKTPGTITATATVSSQTFDPDVTNDVEILTTTVEAIPPETSDLSVIRTDNEDSVNLGQQYIYTLTVTNNGPNDATGVVLTENLPSGVNFISRILSQGFASFNSFNQILTANFGTITSGQTATVNITVNPFVAGNLVSTTSVTSNKSDQNPINNELIDTKLVNSIIPAAADIELTQSVNNLNPSIGDQVTFTLTLTNKGPGSATGIEVKDILPKGLEFISALPEQGIFNQNTGIWDVGNIRDNLSRTLQITAKVNSPGSIINTAEVIAVSEIDPDSTPGNNNPQEDDQASITLQLAIISGTPGNDNLTGTDKGDYIDAREGRDVITAGKGDDVIVGASGGDILTGGEGNDQFVYTSIRDRGDTITDFEVGKDNIVLTQLLDSLVTGGYNGTNAIADGYVKVVQGTSAKNFSLQIDTDGLATGDIFRPFITVNLTNPDTLNSPSNFVF